MTEEIDREGGAIGDGERRTDLAPEKGAGTEAVNEQDRRAPVSVALDVNGAGTDGDAQQIGVDGNLRRVKVVRRDGWMLSRPPAAVKRAASSRRMPLAIQSGACFEA